MTKIAVLVLALLPTYTAAVGLSNAINGVKTTYEVIKEGPDGDLVVSARDTVTVHATGIVQQTDKKFWSTKDSGQSPFTYMAGVNKVIKGWVGHNMPAIPFVASASPHSLEVQRAASSAGI